MKHKIPANRKKNIHARPLKEDWNAEGYAVGLKSSQERAWLGRNAFHFEKLRRPDPKHNYD